jgi:hypothetical protein
MWIKGQIPKRPSYDENGLKICSDCKNHKDKSLFPKNKSKYDGLSNICKFCTNARSRDYCKRNQEKDRIRRRIKYLKYKERELKAVAIYKKNRCNIDPGFKLLRKLRDRHSKAVKAASQDKKFRTTDLLGCTADFLKNYIEKQFTDSMSWDNYGTLWHIDHIYPLSLVNWDNEDEVKKACNFNNLRPLLAIDNIRKGKKIIYE